MKALLIGYSDIARRRVLPALSASGVDSIDIASISATKVDWPGKRKPRHFRDYDRALLESDADMVYISTVNNLHAELAQKALERGLHVVIDKPACLGLEATRHIVELARRKQLCLAEATVTPTIRELRGYAVHSKRSAASPVTLSQSSVFLLIDRRISGTEPIWAEVQCGISAPTPLPPAAYSSVRHLLRLSAAISTSGEVDTGFSLLATYPEGRSVVGSFGYTTGYINRLDIIGPRITVTMDRAFSPLPSTPADVTIRTTDQTVTITVPAADTFALFFADVFRSIAQGDFSRFADAMLEDANEMDRLRLSANLAI